MPPFKHTLPLVALLLCCTVTFYSSSWSQDTPPTEPSEPAAGPQDSTRDPEFKKDSAKADFEKGKSLFEEGNYKEAEALFKKARAETKAKEDKDAVESWVQAAGGLQLVEKVRQLARQNQVQQAYQQSEAYLRKYRGTPAESSFRKLLDELEAQFLVVIENFDTPSAEFTEKYGKTFVTDPKLQLDGTTCLRWTNTQDRKPAVLKVRGVPQDWSKFDAVELWVNIISAPGTPEAALVCGDSNAAKKKKKSPAKKKAPAEAPTDILLATVRLPGGTGQWQKVRIPISDFRAQENATLTSVMYFQIQVAGGRAFNFLIDKIAIVKKNPGAGAAGADSRKKTGGK